MKKFILGATMPVLALAAFVWMKWPEVSYTPQGFAFHYQDIGVTVNILECGKQIGPRPCANNETDALLEAEKKILWVYPKIWYFKLTT